MDFADGELALGDRFLLVSDGVWGVARGAAGRRPARPPRTPGASAAPHQPGPRPGATTMPRRWSSISRPAAAQPARQPGKRRPPAAAVPFEARPQWTAWWSRRFFTTPGKPRSSARRLYRQVPSSSRPCKPALAGMQPPPPCSWKNGGPGGWFLPLSPRLFPGSTRAASTI